MTCPEFLEPSIEERGWLRKRTSGLIKRWKWRYVVLHGCHLAYFHKDTELQPKFTLNFDQVTVSVEALPEKHWLVLTPLACERSFIFQTQSQAELSQWAAVLMKAVQLSDGYRKQLFVVSIKKRFWRYPRLSHLDFIQRARSGDLLLFTSKKKMSALQRGVTNSKYDHVAIIVEDSLGSVSLFESLGKEGVTLLSWGEFMMHSGFDMYTRIVYRPLELERTGEFVAKLAGFIQEHTGKHTASLKKILFKRGSTESFFGSELIASAYQSIGLLGGQMKPWTFRPSHFSDEYPLKLEQGKLLGLELIDFDL